MTSPYRNTVVVGGSGRVGRMVLPALARTGAVTVFDPMPPPDGPWRHVCATLDDPSALREALHGADGLVFMAMGPMSDWGSLDNARAHLEISVAGLYIALRIAVEEGIGHAVLTSSLSVYTNPARRTPPTVAYPPDDTDPDADDFYGLAKRLGEQVARTMCRTTPLSVVALRLCMPAEDELWDHPERLTPVSTAGRDVASAVVAALQRRGHGFEAMALSGDAGNVVVDTSRARELLGWTPSMPAPTVVAT